MPDGPGVSLADVRVLGLDLSLTCSGWAHLAAAPSGQLSTSPSTKGKVDAPAPVSSGLLRPPSRMVGAERLSWVCDRVAQLCDQAAYAAGADASLAERGLLVVLEGYSFGSQGRATFSIGELGGAVRMVLFRLGVPFVEVPPAVLKKFASGSGQASKDVVLLAAARRGGELFSGGSNDEADAFWLLVAGLAAAADRGAGPGRLLAVPASHEAALAQVEWGPLDRLVAGVAAGSDSGGSAG